MSRSDTLMIPVENVRVENDTLYEKVPQAFAVRAVEKTIKR